MYEFEDGCDCSKSKPIIREGLRFCNEECYLNWKAIGGIMSNEDTKLIECPKCNGKNINDNMCSLCEGSGKIYIDEDGIVWGVGDKDGE